MIDPILSLAFSIHSNPGVYAVLLGSGASRAAGIPTGWEVVLDLIRKMAGIMEEDCGPDPGVWYKEKFKEEPDYSKIIDAIAKSRSERGQLLKRYFEPTNGERVQGLKIPTAAHKAIANLIKNEFIRIVITTNFDRLIEKALEDVGVFPTVIDTPDAIEGALPLTHTNCAVIKVHGDYLDTRIKNTAAELEEYDEILNKFLDRVFDEFGLIVCGWSAEWDSALRSAIERCHSHRFSTYWTSISDPGDAAQRLLKLRRAEVIKIRDANSFFIELEQKVMALHDLDRPHPLSAKLAVASLKRYLSEERFKILIHDLLFQDANKLYEEFSGSRYSLSTPFNFDVYRNRILKYETLTEVLRYLIAAGCYWGEKVHEGIWADCIERVNVPRKETSSIDIWENLKYYPSLLLLYAGGISSIIAKRYHNLAALFAIPKCYDDGVEIPLILKLAPTRVIKKSEAEIVFNKRRNLTPLNEHLQELMRESFKEYLPDNEKYIKIFDRFEYLLALIYADMHEKKTKRFWGPVGCFLWRNRDEFERHIINEIDLESTKEGENWSLLKVGLFDGSFERFKHIETEYFNFFKDIPYF